MKIVNGQTFKKMVISGSALLHNNHPEVDALNVFPVPDGDTGTNMSLTFTNGADQIEGMDTENIFEISKVLSKGLLMGARGNSGVILSQIFRGISKSFKGKSEVTTRELAEAFANGSRVAYKAVMRPVEGTILTVIRESSEAGVAYATDDMEVEDWFAHVVEVAEDSLNRTPELLPVLKEVGVVDSGGAGLLLVFKGFLAALRGEEIKRIDDVNAPVEEEETVEVKGYRTEFIMKLAEGKEKVFKIENFKNELERIPSERLTIVEDEGIVRCKLYTEKPGYVLNISQRFGEFLKIDIESPLANELTEEKKEPEKELAIISVAAGEGVKNVFKELHCDYVVSGGQTMNPSTEKIVAAVREANARHAIILPNNSNIILTANQAKEVLENEVDVIVIPSRTIPEGITACVNFNTELDLDSNVQAMNEALGKVKTGQVTYAVKDRVIDGIDIKAGDYMALCEKTIKACVPGKMAAFNAAVDGLIDDDAELVTLIYGEDVTEDEVAEAQEYVEDRYDVEVEMVDGQQPVYSFIIGVE